MIGKPAKYQRTGIAFVAALVVLVVVLGWRAASLVGPGRTAGRGGVGGPQPGAGRHYLVYRTYTVADRGADPSANDDAVVYEFYRYDVGDPGTPERLAREVFDGFAAGSPWMAKVSDTLLLFVRKPAGIERGDASWVDASGNVVKVPDTDPDILWTGLPSPDGAVIAYADRDKDAVSVLSLGDGLTRSFSTAEYSAFGRLEPIVWEADGSAVYLKPVSDAEAFVPGLWRLDVGEGALSEVAVVRRLGLANYTVSPASDMLVGSTFGCDSIDRCGTGPSVLYAVRLDTGASVEVLADEDAALSGPLISPDGGTVAYTVDRDGPEVRLVDPDDPDGDRRLISGRALAWTPDGRKLVIDRDDELQLYDIATGAVAAVARRTGRYQDNDFKGVDFVGIVDKR